MRAEGSSLIPPPSSLQQILHLEERALLHVFLRRINGRTHACVPRDLERFPQRKVLVMRYQDRDGPSIAREQGSFAGQLTLADEPADVFRQVENFERLFHCRTV